MRRIQFVEIHEHPRLPTPLRDDITDALQFGLNLSKAYAPLVPLLQSMFDSAHSRAILDLCSGGGGPWSDLSRKLRGGKEAFRITLTDKFPNLGATENLAVTSKNQVTYLRDSIDAANVPVRLKGFRTMFTSFHHFSPDEARAVLRNAADARENIAIFEITRRAPSAIALMIPWALLPFLFTPWIRPFRWSRLLWTYLIPVIPLVFLFDGVVSCLRSYAQRELREMIESLSTNGYEWQVGEHCGPTASLPITYIVGFAPTH